MTNAEKLTHEAKRDVAQELIHSPIDYLSHSPWLKEWMKKDKGQG